MIKISGSALDVFDVDLRQKIKEIPGYAFSESLKSELANEFNYLYSHVPSLFDMVYKNDAPYMEHLEVLMSNFSKVASGGLDHKNATENVVNHLNGVFIDDKHKISQD